MSESPLPYQSVSASPNELQRPTAITVLAILGIVFGGLGVLCLGTNLLFSLIGMATPAMTSAMRNQPATVRIGSMIFSVIGFALSGVLLLISIACLSLKPAARKAMVTWAIVDIIYDAVRLLITVLVILPLAWNNLPNNPTVTANPNGQAMMHFARIGGIVGAFVSWIFTTTFAAVLLIYFQKPQIVAAFEGTTPQPMSAPPPPPLL